MACEIRTMSWGTTRPRAEVQMPDFAVTDLSLGETDGQPRRAEQRAGRFRPEAMQVGVRPSSTGVALAAGTEAPAVEHDQDDRGARPMPLCHIKKYGALSSSLIVDSRL